MFNGKADIELKNFKHGKLLKGEMQVDNHGNICLILCEEFSFFHIVKFQITENIKPQSQFSILDSQHIWIKWWLNISEKSILKLNQIQESVNSDKYI